MELITKKTLEEAFFINFSEFSDEEMFTINGEDCPFGGRYCYGLPCYTWNCVLNPPKQEPTSNGCGN